MPTAPHPQSTDELYQALRENHQRPYGRTRTVTAEELVDAAERFAEPVALVHALLELQEAYTYGSEPRKSPVVFARLLNLFDEQPDVFDERLRHQLFWRFKWVANALRALPEIPLASLRQWLTEMRDRYEKAGLGLQPYYGQAYQLAAHVGEDTTLAYELWAGRTPHPAQRLRGLRDLRARPVPPRRGRRRAGAERLGAGPGREGVLPGGAGPLRLARAAAPAAHRPRRPGPRSCTSPATAAAAAIRRWPGRSAGTWSSAR